MTVPEKRGVERLRELLRLATARPWFNDDGDMVSSSASYDSFTGDWDSEMAFETGKPADAALIVAAVNALPALLAVADAAREVAGLYSANGGNGEWWDAIEALAAAVRLQEEGKP